MRGVRPHLTLLLLALSMLLPGCGQRGPLSSQDVFGAFEAAGLHQGTITPMSFGRDQGLSYREWVGFSFPETEGRGGMLVVCATNDECDDVFVWLYRGVKNAEKRPSFLRSRDGTVLLQLRAYPKTQK